MTRSEHSQDTPKEADFANSAITNNDLQDQISENIEPEKESLLDKASNGQSASAGTPGGTPTDEGKSASAGTPGGTPTDEGKSASAGTLGGTPTDEGQSASAGTPGGTPTDDDKIDFYLLGVYVLSDKDRGWGCRWTSVILVSVVFLLQLMSMTYVQRAFFFQKCNVHADCPEGTFCYQDWFGPFCWDCSDYFIYDYFTYENEFDDFFIYENEFDDFLFDDFFIYENEFDSDPNKEWSNAQHPLTKPNAKHPLKKPNAKHPLTKPNTKHPLIKPIDLTPETSPENWLDYVGSANIELMEEAHNHCFSTATADTVENGRDEGKCDYIVANLEFLNNFGTRGWGFLFFVLMILTLKILQEWQTASTQLAYLHEGYETVGCCDYILKNIMTAILWGRIFFLPSVTVSATVAVMVSSPLTPDNILFKSLGIAFILTIDDLIGQAMLSTKLVNKMKEKHKDIKVGGDKLSDMLQWLKLLFLFILPTVMCCSIFYFEKFLIWGDWIFGGWGEYGGCMNMNVAVSLIMVVCIIITVVPFVVIAMLLFPDNPILPREWMSIYFFFLFMALGFFSINLSLIAIEDVIEFLKVYVILMCGCGAVVFVLLAILISTAKWHK